MFLTRLALLYRSRFARLVLLGYVRVSVSSSPDTVIRLSVTVFVVSPFGPLTVTVAPSVSNVVSSGSVMSTVSWSFVIVLVRVADEASSDSVFFGFHVCEDAFVCAYEEYSEVFCG